MSLAIYLFCAALAAALCASARQIYSARAGGKPGHLGRGPNLFNAQVTPPLPLQSVS